MSPPDVRRADPRPEAGSAKIAATASLAQAEPVALRCAWLRAHAWQVDTLDPSGQLAAQLRDFADLLEVAEREGWWSR